jgi:DNA ligase-1
MTPLAAVVTASKRIAETSARSRKVSILAELLKSLEPREVPVAAGFLSGLPRQGRVGVGYSTIYGVEHAAAAVASLTVGDVDVAISQIQRATGSGSASRRSQLLADLLARATEEEVDFLRRLFTGELRQGRSRG